MWITCTIDEWKETAGQVGIHPTRISHTNSTPRVLICVFPHFVLPSCVSTLSLACFPSINLRCLHMFSIFVEIFEKYEFP